MARPAHDREFFISMLLCAKPAQTNPVDIRGRSFRHDSVVAVCSCCSAARRQHIHGAS
jgi:hypothetical protein